MLALAAMLYNRMPDNTDCPSAPGNAALGNGGAVPGAATISGVAVSRDGDLLGLATAARRAIERNRAKLAPPGDDHESFEAWWIECGGDPDDIEALADGYITYREIAAVVESVQPEPEPERDASSDDKPSKPSLLIPESAERFAEWIRLSGKCGSYSAPELSELYREHCAAEDLIPVGELHMRGELEKLSGITKKSLRGKRKNGQRHRPIRWTIQPLEVSDRLPWPELPEREAA